MLMSQFRNYLVIYRPPGQRWESDYAVADPATMYVL